MLWNSMARNMSSSMGTLGCLGDAAASLTCPLEHVLNILRCPRHKTGLICVLEPQDESPLVLLGKDVVVQGSAEATQVQEA